TTYTVTGANGSCTNASMVSVTVNALPTVTAATNNTLICTGQTSTLTAGGASTYTWNPGGPGTSIAVSPTVTTTYTVTGTDANGCDNNVVITQSVSLCTSLADLSASGTGLSVYPNPTSGRFTIVSSRLEKDIEVLNVLGEKITFLQSSSEKTEVDLSKEANGIYFIKITEAGRVNIKKLIKQ
ncbi:MAG: T9SS type A sorting domain-containing protein, partial [Bacteroidia bacterium]